MQRSRFLSEEANGLSSPVIVEQTSTKHGHFFADNYLFVFRWNFKVPPRVLALLTAVILRHYSLFLATYQFLRHAAADEKYCTALKAVTA